MSAKLASEQIRLATEEQVIEHYHEQGWTDGLPIVAPTSERIWRFLDAARLDPDTVVAEYQPRARRLIAEKIAINAIMAGCKPEYMPFVVAACKAICTKEFALNHIATLSSAFPLFIMSGPQAKELGFNSGQYVFGPGNRPNATVGRAMSLIAANCFDAKVGGIQRGSLGHAGRYAPCIAENDGIGWPGLHVDRGFHAEQNVVTAYPTGNPPIWFGTVNHLSAEQLADRITNTICRIEPTLTYHLCVLSPPVAEVFIRDGWSKKDIEQYAIEHARLSVADLKRSGRWQYFGTPDGFAPEVKPGEEDDIVYVLKRDRYRNELWQDAELVRPAQLLIVVAGGDAGRLAAIVPSYNVGTNPASCAIDP